MTMPSDSRFSDYLTVISVGDFWSTVKRRWWLVAACGLIGLVAAVIYCRFNPDQYVSRTIIRFIPQQVSERYVPSNETIIAEQRANALTQSLASTLTARKLIQGIGLYPELRRFLTSADLVARFQRDLSVTTVAYPGSSGRGIPSVAISFRSSDAGKAKQVTQQLLEIVYETDRRYKGDESLGTTEFLNSQIETTRGELEELEARLSEIGGQDRIGGDHQWAMKVQNLHNLESRLGQVQSNLRGLRQDREERMQEIREAEAQLRRVPESITVDTEAPSVEVLRIREWLHDTNVHLMRLRERYKSTHPDIRLAEVAEARFNEEARQQQAKDVEQARKRQSRAIRERIGQLKANEAALDTVIRTRRDEETTLARQAQAVRATTYNSSEEDSEYLSLTREYEGLKGFFLNLQRKLEESRVATEMERVGRGEVIEVVEPPTMPPSAEQPVNAVKMALGFGGGMGFGSLILLIWMALEPRVRTEAHLQLWQGAVLLAEIPGEKALKRRWPLRLSAGTAAMVCLMLLAQGCSGLATRTREDYLKRGDAALARQEYRTAILEYRRAVKEDARYGEAHEKLSALLLRLGEAEEAYPSLLRAAELLPGRREAQLRLADYTHRVYLGDPARPATALREIEEIASKLLVRWPEEPDGYRYEAFVLTERHRPQEAMAVLNSAIGKIGPNPALVCDLASLHNGRREFERSTELLSALLEKRTKYEPAYDLLYLHMMENQQVVEAGGVLKLKWQVTGKLDAGLQYAAHIHSTDGVEAAAAQVAELAVHRAGDREGDAKIGDFWLNRGEGARARAAYESGLKIQGALRSLYVGRMVEQKIAEKKKGEARAFLEEEIRKAPKDATLAAYRAALDVDSPVSATQKRARMELESIAQRVPHSAFVRYHLGRSYLRVSETMKAAAQLERCVRLDPNYAPGWLALAEAELYHGNLHRAESRVDVVLAKAPNHPDGLLLKARLQKAEGRLEEAEQSLREAGKAGAGQDDLVLERASIELQRGNSADCLRLLAGEWEGRREDERYVLLLARAEFASGNEKPALERLSASVAGSPESRQLRELYANLLTRSGDVRGALEQFSMLKKAHPNAGEYTLAVADLHALSGKFQESAKEYQAAQKALPDNRDTWLHYAAVLTATGELDGAHDAYVKALSLDSGNPYIMNNLAYLLARRGRSLDYALQLAQDAARALPQHREPLDTLAYVHLRVGMKKAALGDLDRLIRAAGDEEKSELAAAREDVRRGETQIAARRLERIRDNQAARWGGARL
jgi:predicted Zn-dependent protease/uncharacterized protein involved in exopolysaccharide biosynthesis